MINSAGSVDNTQDSSYQCGHSDVAHSEPLRENAAKTDPASLLTAAPLAEALRFYADQDHLDDPGQDDNPSYMYQGSRNGYPVHIENGAVANEALTQAETLIKHSEAVWAVVEKANNPWGFTHDELARFINTYEAHLEKHGYYESIVHALKSLFKPHLPVEALELMELKKDA